MVRILLLSLLLQGPAAGVIRGQILIPSARASDRIQVILQRSDGPVAARSFSDSLGNYEFRNLTPGSYEILVSVEGYEDVRQTVGIGTGLFGSQTVNIPLREKTEFIRTPVESGSDGAVVDVSELSRNHPRRAVQDYEKAVEEMRKGNAGRALELLTGVLKLAPDFYAAHNTLGTIYQKASRYRDAEKEYRRARELNARSAEPLTNLGSLFIQEADARSKEGEDVTGKILDNALDILEEAIKIKRSAMAYHLLGSAYYKSAFYEEAEANLKHALEFPMPVATTRLMLANLYIKQKDWAKALLHLDAYLAENPNAPERPQIQETRAKVVERVR